MARLYTEKEIERALQKLRIKPVKGLVNTKEAAAILSWRAEEEFGITHKYPESAVRRHVEKGHLETAGKKGSANHYRIEAVLELPITPNRGLKQRQKESEVRP